MKHPDGFQIILAIDQFINTLFAGYADESLSSRAWRLYLERNRKWAYQLINLLFFWQKDHCKVAYESELERMHLPPSMRK